jgi:hypothetical protein
MAIYLAYSLEYAGLCNQLYLISNSILEAINTGVDIYIPTMNVDIFSGKRVQTNDILDIHKTNENINNLLQKNVNILKTKIPDGLNWYVPKLLVYPVMSVEILGCLEFQESIKLNASIPEKYNAIHFRLDIDSVVHHVYPPGMYDYFMGLPHVDKINFSNRAARSPEVIEYCNRLIKNYFKFIQLIGFELPWYICSAVGKGPVHDSVLWTLDKLKNFITNGNGKIIQAKECYKERELNALVDLLILHNADTIIGFEGSSFSEGYSYKLC